MDNTPDNLTENDFDEIISNIFLNPPKNSKSIQLIFDDIKDEQVLFKKLVEILVKGMKILFSNNNENVNLQDLTDEDFLKIKLYFMSFGFDIIYNINEQPIGASSWFSKCYWKHCNNFSIVFHYVNCY